MSPPSTTSEPIEFVGVGGSRLSGRLIRPTPAKGVVLMAHCFTCTKDLHTSTRMARYLADAGYASLRFDFTGLGDSGGDFSATDLRGNVGDLARAAVALIERGIGPCAMFGHSLGGAAVLLAAQRVKTTSSVIVLGAPSTAAHVRGLFVDQMADIERDGSAEVSIGGRPFTIGAAFLDDLDRHDVADAAANLGRPLLVLVPGNDQVVAPAEGRRLYELAQPPRTLVEIPGADHLLSDPAHAAVAAQAVIDFLDR